MVTFVYHKYFCHVSERSICSISNEHVISHERTIISAIFMRSYSCTTKHTCHVSRLQVSVLYQKNTCHVSRVQKVTVLYQKHTCHVSRRSYSSISKFPCSSCGNKVPSARFYKSQNQSTQHQQYGRFINYTPSKKVKQLCRHK